MATDHVSLLLDARLFSGIEQEGPYKGLKTLFVADPDLTWEELAPHTQGHAQLYFGAARLSPINWQAVEQALLQTGLVVTAEAASVDCVRFLQQSIHPQMDSVLATAWQRLHLVLTALMLLPSGEHSAPPLDLQSTFKCYRQFPNNISVKLDWGTRVLVISKENAYVNDFTGDYSSDKKLL